MNSPDLIGRHRDDELDRGPGPGGGPGIVELVGQIRGDRCSVRRRPLAGGLDRSRPRAPVSSMHAKPILNLPISSMGRAPWSSETGRGAGSRGCRASSLSPRSRTEPRAVVDHRCRARCGSRSLPAFQRRWSSERAREGTPSESANCAMTSLTMPASRASRRRHRAMGFGTDPLPHGSGGDQLAGFSDRRSKRSAGNSGRQTPHDHSTL